MFMADELLNQPSTGKKRPGKPRGRMPASVLVTVRLVPADYTKTWKPLVDKAFATIAARKALSISEKGQKNVE
jgi:hypothetical protein